MAMKDITDKQVCAAVNKYQEEMKPLFDTNKIFGDSFPMAEHPKYPYETLVIETGQPEKVCYRAMERAADRDLIEYGVSLRTGWLTDKGKALIKC